MIPHYKLQRGITQPILGLFGHICTHPSKAAVGKVFLCPSAGGAGRGRVANDGQMNVFGRMEEGLG